MIIDWLFDEADLNLRNGPGADQTAGFPKDSRYHPLTPGGHGPCRAVDLRPGSAGFGSVQELQGVEAACQQDRRSPFAAQHGDTILLAGSDTSYVTTDGIMTKRLNLNGGITDLVFVGTGPEDSKCKLRSK